jgi:hypothetical protein
VLACQAAGTLKTSGDGGAGSLIELTIYGDRAAGQVSDIERLTSRVGVGVEQHGQRVILRVLPQGNKNSKD